MLIMNVKAKTKIETEIKNYLNTETKTLHLYSNGHNSAVKHLIKNLTT